MTTTETQDAVGPRTYQSAWQWNEDRTAKLMTAEEWLEEEASIDAATDDPDDGDDGPSRAGIMRAIAAEIASLRRAKTQWAEQTTRLIVENTLLRERAGTRA